MKLKLKYIQKLFGLSSENQRHAKDEGAHAWVGQGDCPTSRSSSWLSFALREKELMQKHDWLSLKDICNIFSLTF